MESLTEILSIGAKPSKSSQNIPSQRLIDPNKHIPPSNIVYHVYLIELLKFNFWVACQPTKTENSLLWLHFIVKNVTLSQIDIYVQMTLNCVEESKILR